MHLFEMESPECFDGTDSVCRTYVQIQFFREFPQGIGADSEAHSAWVQVDC